MAQDATQLLDTATRILDAAEALFVEHGFQATSTRMITQRAGVNLAAVNYHFGSKDALLADVFARRLKALNRLSLQALDGALAAHAQPSLPALVRAYVDSARDFALDPSQAGARFVRLMSRAFVEPPPSLRGALARESDEVVHRYLSAFRLVLPHLTEPELHWRLNFAFGTIFNAFAGNNILRLLAGDPYISAREPERVARQLVPYLVAALGAPEAPG